MSDSQTPLQRVTQVIFAGLSVAREVLSEDEYRAFVDTCLARFQAEALRVYRGDLHRLGGTE